MRQLKKTAHATYVAKYHMVWIPKFRMPILGHSVEERLKEILKGIAQRYGFEIDTMEVIEDHVHLFVSFPPVVSIAQAVQIFKGVSARRLNEEFPEMEEKTWGELPSGPRATLSPRSITRQPVKPSNNTSRIRKSNRNN